MQPFQNTATKLRLALTNATRLVGNDAVNHFKENWTRQGFDGQPWKQVKRRIPGTNAFKYPKKKDASRRTRGILFGKGSGRLKRSIRVTKVMHLAVAVGTDVPYAQVHNEGGKAGRGSGFNMPKRPFIGMDRILEAQIKRRLDAAMDSVFSL